MHKRRTNRRSKSNWRFTCDALESRTLLAGAGLLKDINTGTVGSGAVPVGFAGTQLLMTASPVFPVPSLNKLYKTNGTSAGTSPVFDTYATVPAGETGVPFNGKLLLAYQYPGQDFASIDNTGAATFLGPVYTVGTTPFTPVYPQHITVAGTHAFATVGDFQSTGYFGGTLWMTDGTPAGTQLVSQATGNTAFDTNVSFAALGSREICITNQQQVWATDGTAAGTTMLLNGLTLSSPKLTTFNGKTYFFASTSTQSGLWATDGTAAGTSLVLPCYWNQLSALYAAGTKLFFFSNDPNSGYFLTLYDITTTAPTPAIVGGQFDSSAQWFPRVVAALPNGKIIFHANGVGGLWSSDGTVANTLIFTSLATDSSSLTDPYPAPVESWGVLGNTAYFGAWSTSQPLRSLYATDGTVAGTHLVTSLAYDALSPQYFLNFNGKLYFQGTDLAHGSELWSTDGTTTAMAFDLNTTAADSNVTFKGTSGTKTYFDATDAVSGRQPWVTDGSVAGTHMLAALSPSGMGGSGGYVSLSGKAYFLEAAFGYPGQSGLYQTDGTAAGTVQVKPNGLTIGNWLTVYNNQLYFTADDGTHGQELYKSDGTAAGTSMVADLFPGSNSSSPESLAVFNGKLLFSARTDNTSTPTLFATDGTTAHTIALASFPWVGSVSVYPLTVLNNKAYFVITTATNAPTLYTQLWQTDGTAAGTFMVTQLLNTPGSIGSMVSTGSMIYFTVAPFGGAGSLWRCDGTAAGTQIMTLPAGASPGQLYLTAGTVYMTAPAAMNQVNQLWTVNSSGAARVGTVYVDGEASTAGGLIYFMRLNGPSGWQFERSDGTAAGTTILTTLPSNIGIGGPSLLNGNTYYFIENDGTHGYELASYTISDVVSASTGVTNITLAQDADHAHIDWTAGTSTGQIAINSPTGLIISGNGMPTTLTLQYTNNLNPLPNNLHLRGTFTINGLTGTNPLASTNLDIGNSTIFIKYASTAVDPISLIQGYVKNGFNGGAWNGVATPTTGAIFSNYAAANPLAFAVGYADSADLANPAALPANTLELRYAAVGDTNLDGTVGLTDLAALLKSFNTGTRWDQGDVTYGTTVGLTDLAALLKHFGNSIPSPAATPAAAPDSAAMLTSVDPGSQESAVSGTDTTLVTDNQKSAVHKVKKKSKVHRKQ